MRCSSMPKPDYAIDQGFKVFIGKYNARNMFNQDTIQNKTHTHTTWEA